jgi:hypothetical protein
MARPVHFFWMYGMFGPITDPGSRVFTERFQQEFPEADIHESPYRDYDVPTIVAEILALPADPAPVVLVGGTSLGSNNAPIVGQSVAPHVVHGVFGFQASVWGAHSEVTSNVLFAHLFYSELFTNFGLGAYIWPKAAGNTVTNLYTDRRDLPHPGDTDLSSQDTFLAEMRRISANPGD